MLNVARESSQGRGVYNHTTKVKYEKKAESLHELESASSGISSALIFLSHHLGLRQSVPSWFVVRKIQDNDKNFSSEQGAVEKGRGIYGGLHTRECDRKRR